jgi:hypothetical protein
MVDREEMKKKKLHSKSKPFEEKKSREPNESRESPFFDFSFARSLDRSSAFSLRSASRDRLLESHRLERKRKSFRQEERPATEMSGARQPSAMAAGIAGVAASAPGPSSSAAPAEAPSGPPPPKHESYRAPDVPRRM